MEMDRKGTQGPWRVREAIGAQQDDLDKRVQESAARSAPLFEATGDLKHVAELALHELTTALEELRVSSEELRAQNEALYEAQLVFEAEQRRYRELFELAPDAYFVLTGDGAVEEANRAAIDLLASNEGFVRGKPLVLFVAEADKRPFRALLNRVKSSGRVLEMELWLSPRSRTPVQVSIRAAAARGANRDVVGIRLILRDLTERNASEETRRKLTYEQAVRIGAETAARRFRFLAETGRDLASSLDTNESLHNVADAAAKFLADYCVICITQPDGSLQMVAEAHRSPERLEMVRLIRERYKLDPALENGPLQTAVRTGLPQLLPDIPAVLFENGDANTVYRLLRRLGPRYGMVTPLVARGRTVGVMGYLSIDSASFGVPDLRLAEEIAVRTALAVDHARLFSETEAANREKAEFLAVVSHELRTPLTAVIGYSELLLSGIGSEDPEMTKQFVERIRVSAWHQLALVEEILIHARLQAAPERLDLVEVDLAAIVRESVHFIEPGAEQKKLALDLNVPDTLLLETHGGKLRQVIINLLANAVKFTTQGGVSISLERTDDDQVQLQVSDTGPGIAPEDLPHVFDRFWQAEPHAPRSMRGAGLGLSVCRRVLHLLGGTITVHSTTGLGTTFSVRLPATPTTPQGE